MVNTTFKAAVKVSALMEQHMQHIQVDKSSDCCSLQTRDERDMNEMRSFLRVWIFRLLCSSSATIKKVFHMNAKYFGLLQANYIS